MVQEVLSLRKGGAPSSTKALSAGLAPSSCTLLKTVFPRITSSPAFHCARGVFLYPRPPEMGHAPFHVTPPCATSSASVACWAPTPIGGSPTGVCFSLNMAGYKNSCNPQRGVKIMAVIFPQMYARSFMCKHADLPTQLLPALQLLHPTGTRTQPHTLCRRPRCPRTHRPPTRAHTEPGVAKAA